MERVSSGTILLAFIAVLCGLLGVYSLRHSLRPQEEAKPAAPQATTVPMAGRDLSPGHTVTQGDVALMRMTREQMKSNGVQGMFMANPDQIIGRTLENSMKRGSTFDTEDFYPDGAGPGIADRLQPGERAVTVSIFGANALIGFAGAGQVVDVLFKVGDVGDDARRNQYSRSGSNSYYARNRRGTGRSKEYGNRAVTLMQGVSVLALDDNAALTDDHKPIDKRNPVAVTLAVSPEQAEVLRVVEGHGEISLSLRHPDDMTTLETIDARTLEDVLGIQYARPRELEVYRGSRVEHLVFDVNGELTTRYDSQVQSSSDKSLRTSSGGHVGEGTIPASSR